MTLRVVAATILSVLAVLPFATGRRAKVAEPSLVEWVPVEMRDRLQTELVGARGRSGSVEVVEGLAAYSGFRQAGVSTQEEIRVPEPEP